MMLFAEMSDATITAIATAVSSVVTTLGGIVLLWLKMKSEMRAVKDANTKDNAAVKAEVSDVKDHVDGVVADLIEAKATVAKQEGKEEGRTQAQAEAGALKEAVKEAVAAVVPVQAPPPPTETGK